MGSFLSLVENLAPGLYVICGLVLFRNIRSFLLARSELRIAQYGLEKELAERQGGRALTMAILMIELLVAVWAVSVFASPTWSEGLPDEEDTGPGQFRTSTPIGDGSFEFEANEPTDIPPVSTARPPSTPQGTIIPSDQRAFCVPGQAWIETPANGQLVFETISIMGTANIEDFAYYRFEIKAASSSEFSVLSGDFTQPVSDGPLGDLVPAPLLPGEYRFRIMIFNTQNEARARCEITVWISDPQPTATPLIGGQSSQ